MKFNYLPPLLILAIACVVLIAEQNQQRQQPASKRFIKGNIPIAEQDQQRQQSASKRFIKGNIPIAEQDQQRQQPASKPFIKGNIPIAEQDQQRQQPASKRFIKGNIPLEEIFAEWNTKGLKGPRYICLCTQTECDTRPSWPQRSFAEGEAIPVLGDFNRNRKQQMGFTQCSPL